MAKEYIKVAADTLLENEKLGMSLMAPVLLDSKYSRLPGM